jgi:multisubunit Na+/H+ antiporter MnhC subunit
MSLNHRQQRQLYRIESRLLQSDPDLAAKLTVFGRLAPGQRLPAWEHIATRRDRIRQAADLIGQAIALTAAAIGLLFTAVFALFTAIVMGGRARPLQPAHQRETTP